MPEKDVERITEGEALFMDWIDDLSVKDRALVTEFLMFDLSHDRSTVNDIWEDAMACLPVGKA